MDWFRRHLNWTFVFGYLAAYVICLLASFFIGFLFPYDSWEALEGLYYLVAIPSTLVWTLLVGSWVLKNKGRSLWNLLWLFFPWIGIFIFLFLENENKEERGGE